jgi:hypothetical protein
MLLPPFEGGSNGLLMTLKDLGNGGHIHPLGIQPQHMSPVTGAIGHALGLPQFA